MNYHRINGRRAREIRSKNTIFDMAVYQHRNVVKIVLKNSDSLNNEIVD